MAIAGTRKRILFIHHSTGGYLLSQGEIRNKLYRGSSSIELWDHGYNLYPFLGKLRARLFSSFHTGLSDQDGNITGIDFDLEISNKDVSCYLPIFDQNNPNLKDILEFDGVIFKVCYPSTKVETDVQLDAIKESYLSIVQKLTEYPSINFGIFTPPPLRFEATEPSCARRAVDLRGWMLASLERENVKLFDFFGLLSEVDEGPKYFGTLKRKYCRTLWLDSHPNKSANIDASDSFVEFIQVLAN